MADTFTVERSQQIDAAPHDVFAKVVDLREWDSWSPWASMDPDMVTNYSGEPGTVGAGSHWVGNRKVGEGRMTITAIEAPNQVDVALSFLKPFKAENTVAMMVHEHDGGSNVTWSMSGPLNVMTKLMAMFGKTMDKMVGPDFEDGLWKLKKVVEG